MKRMILLLIIGCTSALCGADKTLSIGSIGEDWMIEIKVSGAVNQNQKLIAAWANGDKGVDPLNWTEYADAGTVAPGETEVEFTVPEKWRGKSGSMRFFLMSGMPPYKMRYDCITRPSVDADGDLYIDTAIVPDATCDIAVKVQSPDFDGAAMCPFGAAGALFVFGTGAKNCYWFDFLGAKATTADSKIGPSNVNIFGDVPPQDSESHIFRLCAEGLFIDGYRHLAFDQDKITATTTSKISLFARGTGKQKKTVCSIYGATISTNGVPARDYVPCAAPSGKVQMFDRVSKTWAGPAGNKKDTIAFVPGNDIGPYPPDCGVVEGISDAIGLGPTITIIGQDARTCSVRVSLSSGHDTGLLFAVADARDEGTAYSSWANAIFVQKVAADVNDVTVALPRVWWRSRSNVRFAWKSLAGARFDYAVENLVSDGTGKANIITGWTPTTNTMISVNAKTASDVCAFGITSYFFMFIKEDTIYWNFFGNPGSAECDGEALVPQYHDWCIGPDGASIDGNPLVAFSTATEAALSVKITLPFRSNDSNQAIGKTGDASVKSAKIWEGDVLVRDFVPCVVDGVPQFYDNVRRGYYPSRTEAPFAAGDIVVADGDFVAWSNCHVLERGFSIIIR